MLFLASKVMTAIWLSLTLIITNDQLAKLKYGDYIFQSFFFIIFYNGTHEASLSIFLVVSSNSLLLINYFIVGDILYSTLDIPKYQNILYKILLPHIQWIIELFFCKITSNMSITMEVVSKVHLGSLIITTYVCFGKPGLKVWSITKSQPPSLSRLVNSTKHCHFGWTIAIFHV